VGYCTVCLIVVSVTHSYLLYVFNYSFYVSFIVLYVLLYILCVLCFSVVLCIFLPMCMVVYFLFVYNFTDHCHRVETQLQLRNFVYGGITSYAPLGLNNYFNSFVNIRKIWRGMFEIKSRVYFFFNILTLIGNIHGGLYGILF
jgi:hypothetical protein